MKRAILAFAAFLFSFAAAALKAKHAELKDALAKNAFGRPLHMDSKEGADSLRGELYAVLDHPFNPFSEALARPSAWCEILHITYAYAYGTMAKLGTQTYLR